MLSGCSKSLTPNPTLTITKEILKHQYNKRIKEITYEKLENYRQNCKSKDPHTLEGTPTPEYNADRQPEKHA